MQTYPLPGHHFGVEYLTGLDHVITATALSIPGLAAEPVAVPVTLEPQHTTGGWRVRSQFGFLGFFDTQQSANYPHLDRLRQCGAHPSTMAVVEIVPGQGTQPNTIEAAVVMGLAPWMVAVNAPPENATLLAGGEGAVVDTSTAGDLTPAALSALGTAQVFVQLSVVGTTIVCSLDDDVIGSLGPVEDYPQLRAVLDAPGQDTPLIARAYLAGGAVAVDIPPLRTGAHARTDAVELFAQTPPVLGPAFSAGFSAAMNALRHTPATSPGQGQGLEDQWHATFDSSEFAAALPHGSRSPSAPPAPRQGQGSTQGAR